MNDSAADLFARARRVTPGGVHSPVRAFMQVGGEPRFMKAADRATLTDTDGRHYTDYCMAFGPLILGHRDPDVAAAAHAAIDAGWSYGTAEPWSLQLAELIRERIPFAEQIRFVNSGTEAVMAALRLARAATGRNRIVKFGGCYHGHADAVLLEAGSGMAGKPASAGISDGVAGDTLVLPVGNREALDACFDAHADSIAAVIIEPLPANLGLQPLPAEYLRYLAKIARAHGALLIFDEVISGFRVGFGGCAERYGIEPDLVTWGKIIGGGFPVGAFAGAQRLMERLAPVGDVYQAGTLSANPVAMRAGLATLQKLTDGSVYRQLEERGQQLESELAGVGQLTLTRVDSLFWLQCDDYAGCFRALLDQGIYLPPSPVETAFLSAAHTDTHISALAAGLRRYCTSD